MCLDNVRAGGKVGGPGAFAALDRPISPAWRGKPMTVQTVTDAPLRCNIWRGRKGTWGFSVYVGGVLHASDHGFVHRHGALSGMLDALSGIEA